MRLLYVEDEAIVRVPIIRVLRCFFDGLDVSIAESADEAIGLLRDSVLDRAFDFVLSDYDLRGTRKGSDVLDWVKTHASYLEARFLFLSSSPRIHEIHAHALDKPCSSRELRAAIESMLAARI